MRTSSPPTPTSTWWMSRPAWSRRSPAARARCSRRPTWLPDGKTIAALGHRYEGWGREPERHLAVRGRRPRRDADRRAEPVRAARPHAGFGHEQRRDPRRRPGARRLQGRPLAPLLRTDRRRIRAVADRRLRRPDRAADPRRALRLELARGPARRRWRRPGRLPALERDRNARPVGPRRRRLGEGFERAEAPPPHVPQRRRPRRARPADSDRAPRDGRRPRYPGLVPAGRRRCAAARRRDPRRTAHAVRLVARLGVPGPGRGRDRRLLLQPARVGGLRRGVQRRQPPRLGSRSDARRPGWRGRPRRRRARRPGPSRRDGRIVRRLPDELDRRSRRPVPRRR